jgi:hypothetical protein
VEENGGRRRGFFHWITSRAFQRRCGCAAIHRPESCWPSHVSITVLIHSPEQHRRSNSLQQFNSLTF